MSIQNWRFNPSSKFQQQHCQAGPEPPEAETFRASALCRREGCNRPLYRIPENKSLHLCREHYEQRLLNLQKKQQQSPAIRHCKHCGKEIINPRNTTYCDQLCAGEARRAFSRSIPGFNALSHSYWKNITGLFQRSPVGLDSAINPLDDIPALWRLYALKGHYQQSFNTLDGEWLIDPKTRLPVEKLVASITLELCHRYPNKQGGANTTRNIVIAPGFTNRPLQSRCPPLNADERFNGIQASTTGGPLKQSLMAELLARYGHEPVRLMMQQIKPAFARKLQAYPHRKPGYAALYSILVLECKRLGFKHLVNQLNALYKLTADALGLHLEALASAFFIALQTQDAEGLMATAEALTLDETCRMIEKPVDLLMRHRNLRLPLPVYEGSPVHTLLVTAGTVLLKYLRVDIFEAIQTRFLKLYNGTFYKPPVLAYSPLRVIQQSSPEHQEHPNHQQWTNNTHRKRKAKKSPYQWRYNAINEGAKRNQTRRAG